MRASFARRTLEERKPETIILRKLGGGTYGSVFQAYNHKERKFAALKEMPEKQEYSWGIICTTLQEVSVMLEINDKNSDFSQESDISHIHVIIPPSALSDKDDPFQVARRFSHEVATADNVLTSVYRAHTLQVK
ncbi:MAG: hypothetical protein EZS28_048462, partial [Streblomastix strix]